MNSFITARAVDVLIRQGEIVLGVVSPRRGDLRLYAHVAKSLLKVMVFRAGRWSVRALFTPALTVARCQRTIDQVAGVAAAADVHAWILAGLAMLKAAVSTANKPQWVPQA